MGKHSSFGFTVLLEHRMFESPAKSKNAYSHTRGGSTMTGDATILKPYRLIGVPDVRDASSTEASA